MWFKNKMLNYPTALWGVFITGLWVWFSIRFEDTLSSLFVNLTYIGFMLALLLLATVILRSIKSRSRTNHKKSR